MAASHSPGRATSARRHWRKGCRAVSLDIRVEILERAKGIEPSYAAWEAAVLPLNYARDFACSRTGRPLNIKVRSCEPDRRPHPRTSRSVLVEYVEAWRGSGEAQFLPA